MLPFVAGHLILMMLTVRGGLSAADILGRTQGSVSLVAYYGFFVLFVSVHAALGLRTELAEKLGWRGNRLDLAASTMGLLLLATGGRAVWAVYSVSA
jgi:fumarate reductase subunit C